MNKSKILKLFGSNVKNHRKSLNLSQTALAVKSDLSRSCIAQIEAGKAFVTAETLANLCNIFKCSPDKLFQK